MAMLAKCRFQVNILSGTHSVFVVNPHSLVTQRRASCVRGLGAISSLSASPKSSVQAGANRLLTPARVVGSRAGVLRRLVNCAGDPSPPSVFAYGTGSDVARLCVLCPHVQTRPSVRSTHHLSRSDHCTYLKAKW